MFGSRRGFAAAAVALAGGLTLLAAGAASASQANVFAPNYTFSDGTKGFLLTSSGGPINPGVIVGFNPQPDPPGDVADGTLIALLNPADPLLVSPSTQGSFNFLIGLLFPGDGSVIPLPDAPGGDHHGAGFRDVFDGHTFDVTLDFGPGPVVPGSWASFNPQPEPPGDVLGVSLQFAPEDPFAGFSILVDGTDQLTFALDANGGVPEPASWALMLMGFGGLGAVLRARRRRGLTLA
jgi:hypothetical protein